MKVLPFRGYYAHDSWSMDIGGDGYPPPYCTTPSPDVGTVFCSLHGGRTALISFTLPNLIVLGLTVEERLSSTLILYQNSAQELTSSERKRLSATSTSMSYLIHILSLIASLIRVSTGVLAKMR